MCVIHWSVIEKNAKMFCDVLFLLDLWVTWGPLCWFLLGSFMGLLVGRTDRVSVGLAGPRWPPSCIWNLVLAITVHPGSPRDLSSRCLHLLLTWSFLDGTPGKGRHLSLCFILLSRGQPQVQEMLEQTQLLHENAGNYSHLFMIHLLHNVAIILPLCWSACAVVLLNGIFSVRINPAATMFPQGNIRIVLSKVE